MPKPQILDSKPPISDGDLMLVEQKLSVRLPSQYRDFLLTHNGGRPQPNVFSIKGKTLNNRDIIDWFHCVFSESPNDILYMNEIYRGRLPAGFVPIAHDPFGNLLLISCLSNETGKIFFWDHEEELMNEPMTFKNIYIVANSFDEFLDNLDWTDT